MGDDTRPISRRLRFEILRRDKHTCRYCGAQAPDVPLTVDHVVPKALGGSDDPTNLVTACRDCNSGKGSVGPTDEVVADVAEDAERWARAMARAAERQRADRDVRENDLRCFYEHWVGLYSYVGKDNLPTSWVGSISTFLDRGLTLHDLTLLAYVPIERGISNYHAFKYFAGACWKTISDRTEAARRIVESEG